MSDEPVVPPAFDLRALTTARVALGRVGVSLPTRQQLDFLLAHARARDAVHSELDLTSLQESLAAHAYDTLLLQSAADDRRTYLERPDLGRRLDPASLALLAPGDYDAAFIIADGLSALAIERHALPLLEAIRSLLDPQTWRLAPLTIVKHGRVAISDAIGARLGARLAVILIGERPGLSAPDSLGVYLTWHPQPGNTDAQRNCISNIRSEGLSYAEAARTLAFLMHEARRRSLSGVELKADSEGPQYLSEERPLSS